MAKIDSAVTIRFGLFEVDLARGTLARHGTPLRIQAQPFRILELLLRQQGEIVTRDQLCKILWPEGTHVNFDGSLNAALKKLRAALQDDAENDDQHRHNNERVRSAKGDADDSEHWSLLKAQRRSPTHATPSRQDLAATASGVKICRGQSKSH